MPKPKTVVVIKAPPTPAPIAADFPDAQGDKSLLFKPPLYRPIETPAEIFNTYLKQQRFIVAVHEVGHGLASMMVCRPTQALSVTEMNGSVRGGANMTDAHGEDSAIVDLGGIAAEQLVVGSGDCHAGAVTDIKNARQSLRDDRVPEHQIEVIMQNIHRELITIFERDWVPGIVYTATKLAQVGVLEWSGFVELMAQGQRRAFLAGSLQKAANLLGTHDTLHKSIQRLKKSTPSAFDMLANDIKREVQPQRRALRKAA